MIFEILNLLVSFDKENLKETVRKLEGSHTDVKEVVMKDGFGSQKSLFN